MLLKKINLYKNKTLKVLYFSSEQNTTHCGTTQNSAA